MPLKSPFENAGLMINGRVFTSKVMPDYKGKVSVLGDFIIDNDKDLPEEFFIKEKDIEKMEVS